MSGARIIEVGPEDDEIRLDRWFKRHYPALKHGALEKLLRTGQIRIDGKRARANSRLSAGQKLRVPPQTAESQEASVARPARYDERDAEFIRSLVIYSDKDVIALNKPVGLAVQGGTKTTRHIDAMLDALRLDSNERPRLVHRLDRDTSGVLLLARTAKVAATLGRTFQGRQVRKIYWALVVGVPALEKGRIDLPLGKQPRARGERMTADSAGKKAATLYSVLETAGQTVAWLALWPLTGRTHQLRVHCAAIGHPILGDGKYGGQDAFLPAEGVPKQLHLHARELVLPHPSGSGELRIKAELPPHMIQSWKLFGFARDHKGDPFAGVE